MDKERAADHHPAEMALTVVVRSGESETRPAITFDAPRIVIGRGDGCDVRLPDPSVSHRHASLRQRGTDYIVVDEGSTNGTFVGPVRLPPQTPRVVRSGDLVRVGRIWLELRLEPGVPTAQPQIATKEIALALVAGALRAEGQTGAVRLRVREGPDAGQEHEIADFDQPHLIGRGAGVSLALGDADASRRHAEIIRRGAQLFVRDLGSKNGTRLAGEPLPSDREVVWKPGTVLAIGADVIGYEDPLAETLLELERAADERLRDDESVEPPVAEEAGASSTPPSPAGHPRAERDAPIATLPRRTAAARARRGGWTGMDYIIALIAVAVAALSAVGMLWLFGAD